MEQKLRRTFIDIKTYWQTYFDIYEWVITQAGVLNQEYDLHLN